MSADPAQGAGDFEIRHYRPGDEGAIIELYERTFGRPMGDHESPRHWRWEFLENPTGRQAILLAFAGPTLAAQYAALPVRLRIGGRDTDAALSLDTATAAAFRGRGLFPRLARQLYRELGEAGGSAVFGFPNVNSAPTFFGKLGWRELAPFPLLVKPLPGAVTTWLSRRGAAARALAPLAEWGASIAAPPARAVSGDLMLESIESFPADTDDLWNRAREGKTVCVVRDRAYLEWRYAGNPDHPYRLWTVRERGALVGTLVTRRADRFGFRSGFLVDLLCEEARADVADALVRGAERVLREEGAELLAALMYPGSAAHAALRRSGFLRAPERLMPQSIHFGVCPLRDEPSLSNPTSWYVTWGDSDVV